MVFSHEPVRVCSGIVDGEEFSKTATTRLEAAFIALDDTQTLAVVPATHQSSTPLPPGHEPPPAVPEDDPPPAGDPSDPAPVEPPGEKPPMRMRHLGTTHGWGISERAPLGHGPWRLAPVAPAMIRGFSRSSASKPGGTRSANQL